MQTIIIIIVIIIIGKVKIFVEFSIFLYFPSDGTANFTRTQILFYWLIRTRSGRVARIVWSVCIIKIQRIHCVSFFLGQIQVHEPFVSLVKRELLTQFPIDYLFRRDLVFLWCQFVEFIDYVSSLSRNSWLYLLLFLSQRVCRCQGLVHRQFCSVVSISEFLTCRI